MSTVQDPALPRDPERHDAAAGDELEHWLTDLRRGLHRTSKERRPGKT
jgi:hypothetical protein